MINSRTYFLLDINIGPITLKYTRFCHLSCHRGADTWQLRRPVCSRPLLCSETFEEGVSCEDLLPKLPWALAREEDVAGCLGGGLQTGRVEGRVRLSESLGGKARSVPTPSAWAWVSILALVSPARPLGEGTEGPGGGPGTEGNPWHRT